MMLEVIVTRSWARRAERSVQCGKDGVRMNKACACPADEVFIKEGFALAVIPEFI